MAWYSFGPFVLDPSARVLRRDGHPVAITAKIFELLVLLVEGCGQVVAKDELLAKLWPDTTVEEANLAQSISVLRKILCDSPQEHRYIVTIPGRGYAFVAPVVAVNPLQKTPADETSPFSFSSTDQPRFRTRIASGVLLAAACIGAILLIPKRVEPAFEDPAPLTTFRGMEGSPAVSPDGNRVAFTWNGEKQHNFDIYVMPIPSGVPVRLTSDPADDVSPAWSPDGRTIAFLRRVGGERGALLLVPAAGGPEHKVREIRDLALREPPEGLVALEGLVSLAWSPDGHWIAASHRESEGSGEGLHLFSTSGETRQLTSPRSYFGDHMASFSPDGRALAFCRLGGVGASEIYLLPLNSKLETTGEAQRLTANRQWSTSPVWAPGGRTILYQVNNEIRMIDALDRDARSRRLRLNDACQISIGRHLVYSRQINDTNIWRAKVPAAGDPPSQAELFISSTREDEIPRYSPDGNEIAFLSRRSGFSEIWIAKSDGTSPVQLTSFGGPKLGILNWSPDGQSLVFHARLDGHADIFTIAAAGGSPKRLTEDSADDTSPSYSRDGRWIYFASTRSGQMELWKMPATGGAAVQITRTGGARPLESFDGSRIYYRSEPGMKEILSIPVYGGHPVKVAWPLHPWPYDFTITGEGLYYPAPPHSGEQRFIRFLSFATGENRPVVMTTHPFVLGVSVSPDSHYLLFDQLDESASDLMLVKNFHLP